MTTKFVITSENSPDKFSDVALKDEVKTYSFDFSQWAEENHTVTSVTWTSKYGDATIAGQALASNVATAQITFGSAGGNLIQIKAATATETTVVYLDVLAKDLYESQVADDYGMRR